jgi:hypothetical protein
MTRPYSEDIRERALAWADGGETVRSIAEALQISPSCVTKWKNLRRETGGPNGSVDKFLPHHFSVRPLLNGYLAHVECTPLGMIGIDPVNNERLVA